MQSTVEWVHVSIGVLYNYIIHDMIYKCSKKQRLQTGEIKYSYTYLTALLYIHCRLISAIGSQKFVFFLLDLAAAHSITFTIRSYNGPPFIMVWTDGSVLI